MFRIEINRQGINRLLLFLIIIWYLLPIASNRIGTVGLIVIFAIWCLSCNTNVLLSCICYKPFGWFLLWYGYMLLLLLFGAYKESNSLYFFTMTFIFALPVIVYKYYAIEYDFGLKITIQKLSILIFLVTAINTLIVLQQYPMAAKIMAMSGAQEAEKQIYASMGCGGYNYIYSLAVGLMPVLFSKIKLSGFWKVIRLAMLVLSLIVMFMSQYTLALLLIITSFVLCIIYKNSTNSTARMIGIVLVIILTGMAYFVLPHVLTYFSRLISSDNGISTRLMQMASYMSTGEQGYDLGGRLERYGNSFRAFMNSPIFGIRLIGNGTIGGHSSLLDQLGCYGIVGTLPYVLFFVSNFKCLNSTGYRRLLKPTYIIFMILSLINTTMYVYPIGMVLLFIIPMICEDENDQDRRISV